VSLLLVFLGGAVGAPARYLLDRGVQRRYGSSFPWGTLSVNVIGSLLLGALAACVRLGHWPTSLELVIGTGFCGGLTTFSTFGYETVRLLEDGSLLEAGSYIAANVVLGTLSATAGYGLVALAF
jgi:fluoride exporter